MKPLHQDGGSLGGQLLYNGIHNCPPGFVDSEDGVENDQVSWRMKTLVTWSLFQELAAIGLHYSSKMNIIYSIVFETD